LGRPQVDELGEALGGFATSTLSDALDRLGIPGQALGVAALDRSYRLAGRAYTVRTIPVPLGQAAGSVGEYIDDVPPGRVLVLDNGGRLDATVWGDILTTVAHRNRLAGTVIHGVCRDASRSLELGYPIFCRGVIRRTGRGRVQADATEVAVSLGEVRVTPGDLLVGDGDGVVVIPAGREAEVLAVAAEIASAEAAIKAELAQGGRLDQARRRHRYMQLTRK
jgi:regulator of RNase E activity RraA